MNRKGQTTLDFLVAIAIFAVITTGVVVSMHNIYDPYTEGQTGEKIVANRIADQLTEALISEKRFVLNRHCTKGLFDRLNGGTSTVTDTNCDYKKTDSLHDMFGIGNRYHANIVITNGTGSIVTLDNTRLQAGDDSIKDNSVYVARRKVLIGEHSYLLKVRVW